MADAVPLLGALASSSKSMEGMNWGLEVLSVLYKMQFLVVKQVCQLVVDFVASAMGKQRVEELKQQQQQQAGGLQVQVPLEKQLAGEPSGGRTTALPQQEQQQQEQQEHGSERAKQARRLL
jgi:hypothetical protein